MPHLTRALAESDFPAVCPSLGFTESHQVFLDHEGYKKGRAVTKKIEAANIIVDWGVKLGVCELTRRKMKEKEIGKVAEFIKRVLKDGEKPKKTKLEVAKFVAEFQMIEYCFE